MKKLTKILLPIDFSEPSANAFRYALQLADQVGASVEVLNVVYPESEAMDYPVLVAKATETRLEIARESLKKFVDTNLSALGPVLKNIPMISSDLEMGAPVETICSLARRNDINLIIMGSRGENRSGIEKLIGSITAGVVSKAPCPVLVIPDDASFKAIDALAYATDVKDFDPFEIWRAMELLKPYTPDLNIVHVNFKKEGDSKAWEKMETMKAFFDDRSPKSKIDIHNIPGESLQSALNEFIESHNTDMLVMYQPKRSFWDRLFYQSDTKKMALHSHVPLLVLKN